MGLFDKVKNIAKASLSMYSEMISGTYALDSIVMFDSDTHDRIAKAIKDEDGEFWVCEPDGDIDDDSSEFVADDIFEKFLLVDASDWRVSFTDYIGSDDVVTNYVSPIEVKSDKITFDFMRRTGMSLIIHYDGIAIFINEEDGVCNMFSYRKLK